MRSGAPIVAAVVLALVVSGCASGGSSGDAAGGPTVQAPIAQVDETRGGLQGLVSDDSLAGVGGALVRLEGVEHRQTSTDGSGAFAFSLLAEGPYRVSVHTSGFANASLDVRIEANTVAKIHIQLTPLPSLEDYSVTSIADGHLGCSVAVYIRPIDRWQPANLCGIPNLGDQYLVFVPVAGHDVSELVNVIFETAWQPTQLLGSGLNVRISVESDAGQDVYGSPFWDTRGSSPLRFALNRSMIDAMGSSTPSFFEACNPNAPCHFELAAYPWPDTLGAAHPIDVGVNLEQRFTHYVSEFYRFHAPAGFTAIPDA